jgi:outer membrane protein
MNKSNLTQPPGSSTQLGLLAVSLMWLMGHCHAQAQPPDDDRTRYSIGAAVLFDKDGYRGVGTQTLVLPGVSIQNKWVNLFGPQIDLRLIGNDKRSWWIGPRIEYRFDGYEQDDGAVFRGMASRKGGLFYGLSGSVELGGEFELEADYVKAASREAGFDRGAVASLQLSWNYRRGPWTLVPRIGLEYQSSRYVDYYYGVRLGEATALRPAYAGKSTWSPELGLLVRWQASPRQSLFANFNYERYAKEIRNSPLINASGIPQLVLGYQFVLN